MPDSIITRVSTTLPALDLENTVPVDGERLPFVEKTTRAFLALVLFARALSALAAELGAIVAAVNARLDASGHPRSIDLGGAARDTAAYAAAVASVPVELADIAAARRLIVVGIAADADRPLSELYLAELGPAGPRWAGPLGTTLEPGDA